MTNSPNFDAIWVADGDRWIDLARLVAEAAHDPACTTVQVAKVRRGVVLAHRAIDELRRRVGKERNDLGEVTYVVRSRISHEADHPNGEEYP